jgi:hypothetical protein
LIYKVFKIKFSNNFAKIALSIIKKNSRKNERNGKKTNSLELFLPKVLEQQAGHVGRVCIQRAAHGDTDHRQSPKQGPIPRRIAREWKSATRQILNYLPQSSDRNNIASRGGGVLEPGFDPKRTQVTRGSLDKHGHWTVGGYNMSMYVTTSNTLQP